MNTKITILEKIDKLDEILKLVDKNYSNYNLNKTLLFHYLVDYVVINNEVIKNIIKLNINRINVDDVSKIIGFDEILKNK